VTAAQWLLLYCAAFFGTLSVAFRIIERRERRRRCPVCGRPLAQHDAAHPRT
jgi:hypothetical protein